MIGDAQLQMWGRSKVSGMSSCCWERHYACVYSVRLAAAGRTRGRQPGPVTVCPKGPFTLCAAGLTPSDLSYMSVHGTGTPLGDPIELGALGQALSCRGAAQAGRLTIGSVKSCYGHTEGTAGLTGALLATHALHHQVCGDACMLPRHAPDLLMRQAETSHWLCGSCTISNVADWGYSKSDFGASALYSLALCSVNHLVLLKATECVCHAGLP